MKNLTQTQNVTHKSEEKDHHWRKPAKYGHLIITSIISKFLFLFLAMQATGDQK